MSILNNSAFEAISNNINTVLNAFHSGSTIVVFKGNNTVVMSSKVHSEAALLEYINGATTVRICG